MSLRDGPKKKTKAELEKELEELTAKSKDKEEELKKANDKVKDLEAKLDEAKKKATDPELKKKLDEAEKTIAEQKKQLGAAAEALKSVEDLKKRNKELSDRLDETTKKLEAAQKAAKVTGTTGTEEDPLTNLGFLFTEEQNKYLGEVDKAVKAAEAIGELDVLAKKRVNMARRLPR